MQFFCEFAQILQLLFLFFECASPLLDESQDFSIFVQEFFTLFCCCRCGHVCFFVVVLELARVAAGMVQQHQNSHLPHICSAVRSWQWTMLRSAPSCTPQTTMEPSCQDEETTFPEFASSGSCEFVVRAIDTGRGWTFEVVQTRQQLVHARAHEAPSNMNSQWCSCGNDHGPGCRLSASCGSAQHHLVSNRR